MNLELDGKTALITGASKGIGLAVARALAKEGCDLHLAARDGEALAAARKEIETAHKVRVALHALDLSHAQATEKLAADAGDIDILVNNAGAIPAGSLEHLDGEAWRRSFDLKVFGYITLARAFYMKMKGKGGVIVNIIGNSGENWDAGFIAGSTGNAALMSFTKALGGASFEDGIRVVGINPGPVATERVSTLMKRKADETLGDENRWQELFEKYPGGRPASVEEVADLCAFLSSARASYISGTVVTIDGGFSARRRAV
ncbi:NAD(P)-dependent dehydrogenase (short-subunit alcohol dehydrogenase family) [Pseudochelatococcus lubricantis]|uniref:NAD(P)-dependent dehydrogenase (Short-subunit alcohol dehydrogenase family) n=1 Tax=Pseudochelatococcus lubricantis TaxID=1538102 RepID=A0ABX0V1F7_9HYPH|nr:SDR family oxidoreductase [Pseudochelatococcus lubricantis]NIJ59029.1 NAD(P)-dependent dehydrogenase (short-subunit alcohol dehydrogenase family) [Pseudochelatococcus lubricantis]